MGQVIDLELMRSLKIEKVKIEALKRFPWQEMDRICDQVLEPLVRFWSEQKQHILFELVYRFVYEVYVYGMLEAKKARSHRCYLIPDQTWEDIYNLFYQENCKQLVHKVTQDFALFQWLDEWRCESVFILLENLARVWFIEGIQGPLGR